ncbi:receptor-type tyrosine-protein phosphatase eta isoform X3 [Ictalurus punctatus]|uniref:Receptor-type tyrosine-protein phosphatase eta isoform X3 n=1 Tax=Ictalurus punctatus TaxID=7998 RepID=A0A2D0PNU4_ICTPU|nr:receptor-type tyrosine-protein phosphatase eta isoform X3 [Ictalurus punctatus]
MQMICLFHAFVKKGNKEGQILRPSSLASPPKSVGVIIKARTETLLTLEWSKVNNFSYILRDSNGTEIPLTVSADGSVLRCTVSSLSPGTKYSFVLYAMLKGLKHSTFNFTAVTSPSNVASVSVKARSETALTFEWSKVNNNNAYIYILRQSNRSEMYTPMYWGESMARRTVSSLRPGTKYTFTLYTVFFGERSSGYNFSAATNQLEFSWEEVKSSNISYILRDSSKAETTIAALGKDSVIRHTVSALSPGTRYRFTLYTVFEGVRSRGLTFTSVTASLTVTGVHCEHLPGGTALVLVWDAPSGQWTGVEVQMKGRNPQYLNGTRLEFHDLHPALWYDVTLKLCSGDVKGAPVSIRCQTDPRGVIAGVILVLLFIIFLVCLGVVTHRRSVLKRKAQSDFNTNQASSQEAEEGAHNAPVLAKQQSSDGKKHCGQRMNKKKRVKPIQQNPYINPYM